MGREREGEKDDVQSQRALVAELRDVFKNLQVTDLSIIKSSRHYEQAMTSVTSHHRRSS